MMASLIGVSVALLMGIGALFIHIKHSSLRLKTPHRDELGYADDLAWNNRWIEASAIYQNLENQSRNEGNETVALYAHVSRFVFRAESEPVQPLLRELEDDLKLPIATSPRLRLRLLVIEGMLATNYDAALAKQVWTKVQEEASSQQEYRLRMRAQGEIGIADFYLGNVSSAKQDVTRAWAAAKYLRDPAAQVRYASVYAAGLIELRRFDEAIRFLDRAIATASARPEIAYPSIAYNAKIDALRGGHRDREALKLATEYLEKLPSDHLDSHIFQLRLSRAQIYEDLGDDRSAEAEYHQALSYTGEVGFWRGMAQAGSLLANEELRAGKLKEALVDIDRAILASEKLPQELYYLPRNLAIKAAILHRMNQREAADRLYDRALRIANILLRSAPTPNVERLMIDSLQKCYTHYFESLVEEDRIGAAFHVIESVRGRVEADALENHPRDPLRPSAAAQKIVALNISLAQTENGKERTELDSQLADLELELNPSTPLSGVIRARPSLSAIQKSLGEDEVLLEYVLDDPISYVIASTHSHVSIYRISGRQHLRDQILQYRRIISAKQESKETASDLFRELLGPIVEYSCHVRVVVVPDQELHLLPFAALMDSGRYVVETHQVTVSPSATVLALLKSRAPKHTSESRFLGVAPWTDEDEWALPPLLTGSDPAAPFLALPASKTEVENAASSLGTSSTLLLGPSATETQFRSLPLDQYDILHLALHGYADKEYPDRSALIFAPEPNGPDDGQLMVREVRTLRLNASLVTLSACETGDGPFGEVDVANMANAFIEAGGHAVIAALWKIDDSATSTLMAPLYMDLHGGSSAVEALRDSQVRLIGKKLPPYYWAAFQLSGDGSSRLSTKGKH
jgi:CHAT domain-containing protein